MFPILRRHWTLWAAWAATATLLLFANPFGPFGWPELFAGLGSLVLIIDRRARRETLLVIGPALIALLATIDGHGASVSRLVVDWTAFIGAVLLAARAVDDQRELESIAGQIAFGNDPKVAFEAFRRGVADEAARSRRHERAFVLLSIAPHPSAAAPAAPSESPMLRQLAHSRWVFELAEVLRDELHCYAEVVATEGRVLCRVPEIEQREVDTLLERLAASVHEVLSIEIQTGVACFPSDALGVDDLIATADEARRKIRLESVSGHEPSDPLRGGTPEGAAARMRDIRG